MKGTAADSPISSAADGRRSLITRLRRDPGNIAPFTIVALDHLEHLLDDPAFRQPCSHVWNWRYGMGDDLVLRSGIRSISEELSRLPDRRRWARVLEQFRREHLGLSRSLA
jgi:hypothetical protein